MAGWSSLYREVCQPYGKTQRSEAINVAKVGFPACGEKGLSQRRSQHETDGINRCVVARSAAIAIVVVAGVKASTKAHVLDRPLEPVSVSTATFLAFSRMTSSVAQLPA